MQNPKRNKRPAYVIVLIAVVLLIALWCKCCCEKKEPYQTMHCSSMEFPLKDTWPERNLAGLDKDVDPNVKETLSDLKEVINFFNESSYNSATFDTIILSQINIFFDYDSDKISYADSTTFLSIIEMYSGFSKVKIKITSSSDSRGNTIYNDALSNKRTESVMRIFQTKPEKIEIQNNGERKISNGCIDNVVCDEKRHAENRKSEVQFFLVLPKDIISRIEGFSSYYLESNIDSVDYEIHYLEMQVLRQLNILNFVSQLKSKYEQDSSSVNLNAEIEDKKNYFEDSQSSILKIQDNVGSAFFDMSLNINSIGGYGYVMDPRTPIKLEPIECCEIGIYFLDPLDSVIQNEIVYLANAWFNEIPNCGFFIEKDGTKKESSHRIKTDIIDVYESETGCHPSSNPYPTMYLSEVERLYYDNKVLFRKVVLHEFGHVLYRYHEFLHDEIKGDIKVSQFFDEYYSEKVTDAVKENVIAMFNESGLSKGKFDYNSVMNYDIPRRFVKTNIPIVSSDRLSSEDSNYVKEELFPFISKNLK